MRLLPGALRLGGLRSSAILPVVQPFRAACRPCCARRRPCLDEELDGERRKIVIDVLQIAPVPESECNRLRLPHAVCPFTDFSRFQPSPKDRRSLLAAPIQPLRLIMPSVKMPLPLRTPKPENCSIHLLGSSRRGLLFTQVMPFL
jgi:hypothetical protein